MRRSILSFLSIVVVSATPVAAQPSTVILVRHAEKVSQTDPDPILSDAGTQRAKELAAALADAHISTVITTQYQRTILTAAPLIAGSRPTSIVVANSGQAAAHIADVAATILARPAGEIVLVVGHSNTVTAIISALGGPKIPNLCDSQYASMFILEMNGSSPPRLIRSSYGAADQPDATCPKVSK